MVRPIVSMRCVLSVALLAAAPGAQQIDGLDRVPEASRDLLRERGFAVAGECAQMFEPYVDPAGPVFVTADAVAHGYAVALRAVVLAVDRVAAVELRRFATDLAAAAARRGGGPGRTLARLAAVACVLGGDPVPALDWAAAELQRIEVAAARLQVGHGPELEFEGLTFRPERYLPRAGYGDGDERRAAMRGGPPLDRLAADAEDLRRIWQVRRFWNDVALPLDDEAGRDLAFALCSLVAADPELRDSTDAVEELFDVLLGVPAAVDLRRGVAAVGACRGPDELRATLSAGAGGTPVVLRVFAERRTSDSALLRDAGDARNAARMRTGGGADGVLPSGIDLLVRGPLASDAGVRAWRAQHGGDPADVGLAVAVGPRLDDGDPVLHDRWLRAVARLQDLPPAGAPAWTRGDAWQHKQCWTQLGAWAEVRHAWALHAERAYIAMLREDRRPGVVSPYPRFFADTAVLARALAARVTTWIADRPAAVAAARERLRDDPPRAGFVLERLVDAELVPRAVAERERREINPRELPTAVRAALAVPPQQADSRVRATLVIAAAAGDRVDPLARMRAIARLADRCAGLAARSWDAAPMTAEDTEFLRGFGEEIAFVCGYRAFPRPPPDDVPVVVTVAETVGLGGGDRALQVGVGRPEWLWALVPVGDRLVVHQGAVLTYREQAVARRHGELDDAAWRAAARRRALPEPPAFTRGFRVVR